MESEKQSLLESITAIPGDFPGTTKLVASIREDVHLAIKISALPITPPLKFAPVPTEYTVSNPYIPGENITGVDEKNRYLAIYLVNKENQILDYVMMTLSNVQINPEKWALVWEDTFQTNEIDTKKWNFVDGGNGFGNEELQYYTNRPVNARIENEQLIIEAHKETYKNNPYTSAKLTTNGKADWKYGRFIIKAKLPEGQGIWPAIWMMPTDMERYSGWPACGEIDIMELIGHEASTVYGTLHYGVNHTYTGESYQLPNKASFSTDFHEFMLEWDSAEMRWYVDGVLFAKQKDWFSKNRDDATEYSYPAPFDREFYLQLNVAVGGKWPGYPDETTLFPQQMIIDFIKVYQRLK